MTKKAGSERASFFPFIAVTPNLQKIRYAGYINRMRFWSSTYTYSKCFIICATPCSSLVKVTASAIDLMSSRALPIATPFPAASSIDLSFKLSPTAAVSSSGIFSCFASLFSACPLEAFQEESSKLCSAELTSVKSSACSYLFQPASSFSLKKEKPRIL